MGGMKNVILIAALSLSGCATTSQGLLESPAEFEITSEKNAQVFATCVVERLSFGGQLRSDGERYWVIRNNTLGAPITRWDFVPTESGSRAELRTSININTGKGKVQDCA